MLSPKNESIVSKAFQKPEIQEKEEYSQRYNNVDYYVKGEELSSEATNISRTHNNIYFYSPITRYTASKLISLLIELDSANMEASFKNTNHELNTIHLHLLSEGGDLFAANAIYQNITNKIESPVVCHVDGFVSSASLIVMFACDVREMNSSSFIGVHPVKMSVWGKLQFLQQCNESYQQIWDNLEKMYRAHTALEHNGISVKEFLSKPQLLDGVKALKYGIVTKLVN